jgi:peroxiredoxin
MRYLLIFLVISLFAFSCGNNRFGHDNVVEMEGEIENTANSHILLEELTTNNLVPFDTLTLDPNGYFYFKGKIEEPGFYIFRVDRSNFVTLLLEPGQKVKISGDAKNLPESYLVKGSAGSDLLAELNSSLREAYKQVDSLAGIFRQIQGEENFLELKQEIDLAYTRVFENQQEYVKKFIERNPESLASIIALYQFFGSQVLLKETEHFEYFEKLAESLSAKYPENRHVLDLNRRVNEIKRAENLRLEADSNLGIGKPAPEVVMPDPDGKPIALSSLKGKVVLIDFWAAWCNPCRIANIKLKELFDQYGSQGFEIYGISLDRNREQWIQGIKEDKIDWIQVSDLRFWNSPVVSLYNVEAIPYNVLLDKEGNIMAKGMSVTELEEILEKMFD